MRLNWPAPRASPSASLPDRLRRALPLLALLAAVGLVFGSSLANGFVKDDRYLVDRPEFSAWRNLPSVLTMTQELGEREKYPYYRPLTYLSFFVDYHVWQLRPVGYHLENLVLHALTVWLVFHLIVELYADRRLAFLAALLFGVHPVATEPVNFVSGRDILLCTVSILASLSCLLRARRGGFRWLLASAGLYFVSLLGKEAGVTLLLVLVALWALSLDRRLAVAPPFVVKGRALVPFVAATAVYLSARWWVVGSFGSGSGIDLSASNLRLVATCFGELLRLLVLPLRLDSDYRVVPHPWLSASMLLAAAGALGLAFVAVRRGLPSAWRIASLWILVSFLPISNLSPLPTAAVADRYAYLPLLGFCLGVGHLLRTLEGRRRGWALAVAGIVVLGLAARSFDRNGVWKDEISLWRDVVRQDPGHARAHNNLGLALLQTGAVDQAMERYRRAIAIDPGYALAHYNLGNAYQELDRPQESLRHYLNAIRLDPGYRKAHFNLAQAYRRLGRVDDAIRHDQLVVQLDPRHVASHYNLGVAHQAKGRAREAERHYRAVLELDPSHPRARANLGALYQETGRLGLAIREYQLALAREPSVEIHLNLGLVYSQQGLLEEAIRSYQEALSLAPDSPLVHRKLGDAHTRAGSIATALTHYQQAARLRPDDVEAHYLLARSYERLGLTEDARREAEAILRRWPDFEPARDLVSTTPTGAPPAE